MNSLFDENTHEPTPYLDTVAVRMVNELKLSSNSNNTADAINEHYWIIEKVRNSPVYGAILVHGLIGTHDEALRVHAAYIATHVARDLVLAASDAWATLRAGTEQVQFAANTAIRHTVSLGYITQAESERIRIPGFGLRAPIPRDLQGTELGEEYRYAGNTEPSLLTL